MMLLSRLKWLKAAAIGAVLALPPAGGPAIGPAVATPAVAIAAGAAVIAVPDIAEARSRSRRSSGGYSRPSSRTPSVSASSSRSRTPSTSGGYGRPSGSASATRAAPSAQSASDREISRRSSSESFDRYRNQQQGERAAASPPPPPAASGSDGWFGGSQRRPTTSRADDRRAYDRGAYDRGGWGGSRGWSPRPSMLRSPARFGAWDALFLWFLLDNLTSPGHAAFFHHHQNDPAVAQWRAEAERAAAEDPDVRARLDQLDSQLVQLKDQPRDPSYLPPDTPPEAALARTAGPGGAGGDPEGGGFGGLLVLVLIGGGIAFLIWVWIRRRAARSSSSGGTGTMGSLSTATNILRHKLSGEGYSPSLFRVGMTVTIDPTPFILATGATKVAPPDLTDANTLISIQAVGTVDDAGVTLYRLYLPDGKSFFQLHLDPSGHPDECRYFSRLDEVNPASPDEWGFWLDPQEGMIGWPEFETKDGKLYGRLWAPGDSRIPPRRLTESIADLRGTTVQRSEAMLYAAPTGTAEPAPQSEYVLVAAVDQGGQAWIEIHAGIDVNPAALSLA